MKSRSITFSAFILLTLTSCGVDDDLINSKATKEEVAITNQSIESVKSEINGIQIKLENRTKELKQLQNAVEKYLSVFDQVREDQKFIAELRQLDLPSISMIKKELMDLKSSLVIKNKTRKEISIAENKQKIRRRNSLNVSLSQINKWGDSLVAVLHFPNIGYKTLSTNNLVGNGWEILKIESTRVTFIHTSGATKSLIL